MPPLDDPRNTRRRELYRLNRERARADADLVLAADAPIARLAPLRAAPAQLINLAPLVAMIDEAVRYDRGRAIAPPPPPPVRLDNRDVVDARMILAARELVANGTPGTLLNVTVTRRRINQTTGEVSPPFDTVYSYTAQQITEDEDVLGREVFYESERMRLESISLSIGAALPAVYVFQVFRDGSLNCVIAPLVEYLKARRDAATSDKKIVAYKRLAKRAEKMLVQYADGVPEDQMQSVADKLLVRLTVYTPCVRDPMIFEPAGNAVGSLAYTNTRLGHLDQMTVNNPVYVERDALAAMWDELCKTDQHFEYQRNTRNVVMVRTLEGEFKVKAPHGDFVRAQLEHFGMEEAWLCDKKNPRLSEFIRRGVHLNGHVDAVDTGDFARQMPCGGIEYGDRDYMCIDQARAYRNFQSCKFFDGFVFNFTDFRKTTTLRGPGYYQITGIVLTGKLAEIDAMLGRVYVDGCVYPSCELAFLASQGATFDVVAGAWGRRREFNFNDEGWMAMDGDSRLYATWVGRSMMKKEHERYYVRGTHDFLSHIASVANNPNVLYFEDQQELCVTYERESAMHMAHISGVITSCTRINTIEQLLGMQLDKVLRVACDAVYAKPHVCDLENVFRVKQELMKTNTPGTRYIQANPYEQEVEGRDAHYEHREYHKGAGGSGKTHSLLTDKGLPEGLVVYSGPSHKLCAEKREAYGVIAAPHASLMSSSPKWRRFTRASVIIFDECSMLTRENQEFIISRFPHARLIFAGDPCQCPHFDVPGGVKSTPFDANLCDRTVHHTHQYRCTCPILAKVLQNIRDEIGTRGSGMRIALNSIPVVDQVALAALYDPATDFILTHSHTTKDAYTDAMVAAGKAPKYLVKKRTGPYYNGDIVHEVKEPLVLGSSCELRHGFTTHSVQGTTVEGRLFIDVSALSDNKLIYTAISRARKIDQVMLVRGANAAASAAKIEYVEESDVRVARYVRSLSDDALHALLKKEVDETYDTEVRRMGKAYADERKAKNKVNGFNLSREYCDMVVAHNGRVRVSYRGAKDGNGGHRTDGRMYSRGQQALPKTLRGPLVAPTGQVDHDIVNCMPTLLVYVAGQLGVECPNLKRYVNSRDEVLAETGLTKIDLLMSMFQDYPTREANEFVRAIDPEFKALQRAIMAAHKYPPNTKSKNPYGSNMSQHLANLENDVLQHVVMSMPPGTVKVLSFDGFMASHAVSLDVLNALSTKWGVKWAHKPHMLRFEVPHDFV